MVEIVPYRTVTCPFDMFVTCVTPVDVGGGDVGYGTYVR